MTKKTIFNALEFENICTNATSIGNICVGEESIIGAGSVVTQNIPLRSIVCGIPARIIKTK